MMLSYFSNLKKVLAFALAKVYSKHVSEQKKKTEAPGLAIDCAGNLAQKHYVVLCMWCRRLPSKG